jgi:hypothetical protein
MKTHCGYRLSGEPGSWEWHAPASAGEPLSVADNPVNGGRDPI